jgi:hypothetical protein
MNNQPYIYGSVSSGTLVTEELVDAFLDALDYLNPDYAKELRSDYDNYAPDALDEFLHEKLFEALDECAPEGYYFGAHEGDGADFGFWEVPLDEGQPNAYQQDRERN